jgi:hypothetical protein
VAVSCGDSFERDAVHAATERSKSGRIEGSFTIFSTPHCLLNRTGRKINALMSSLQRIVTRLASINRELATLKLRLGRERARVIKVTGARRTPTKRKSV